MKKLLNHIVFVALLSMILCVIAVFSKSKITNLTNDATQRANAVVAFSHTELFYPDESTYMEELTKGFDDCDIIVKGVFTGERILMYEATLSKIKVVDVIKGDSALNGKDIAVFEANYFAPYKGYIYYQNHYVTNLISKDREYYFFLNKNQSIVHKAWNLPEYRAPRMYHLIFPVHLNQDDILIASDEGIKNKQVKYGSVEKYAVVVGSQRAAEEVTHIYQYIIERYALNN